MGIGCCAYTNWGCEGSWAKGVGLRRGRSLTGQGSSPPDPVPVLTATSSLIFGLITCLTGVLGVGLGVEISRRLRRSNPRADPLVCATGLLGSAPFLFLSLASARGSIVATYVSSPWAGGWGEEEQGTKASSCEPLSHSCAPPRSSSSLERLCFP